MKVNTELRSNAIRYSWRKLVVEILTPDPTCFLWVSITCWWSCSTQSPSRTIILAHILALGEPSCAYSTYLTTFHLGLIDRQSQSLCRELASSACRMTKSVFKGRTVGFSLQSVTQSAWPILTIHEICPRNDVVCKIFIEGGPRDALSHAGDEALHIRIPRW